MDKFIIGIVGKKGHGKDTVANMLKKSLPPFEIESFANPIKKGLCAIFDVTIEQLEETKRNDSKLINNIDRTTRQLLQLLGQEWGNELVDPILWVKLLEMRYNKSNISFVISDVRYPHEAKWIKQQPNSFLIKVNRDSTISDDDHISEKVIDNIKDIDYNILNNSTIEDLQSQVEKISMDIVNKL